MSPAIVGALRGLGAVIGLAVLHYFTDSANLHGIVGESIAPLIVVIALAIEQRILSNSGNALFGAVKA